MGRPSTSVVCACSNCGCEFKEQPNRIAKGYGKFCTIRCRAEAKTISLVDRFFAKIGRKTSTGCIPWTGEKDRGGYGRIHSGGHNGKRLIASRVAYELFIGLIPYGQSVLHKCDNRSCISPTHLFLGTQADNIADMITKGRMAIGEILPASKLTEEKVKDARLRYATGKISQQRLADEFGVSQATIGKAICGVTWKHVGSFPAASKRSDRTDHTCKEGAEARQRPAPGNLDIGDGQNAG